MKKQKKFKITKIINLLLLAFAALYLIAAAFLPLDYDFILLNIGAFLNISGTITNLIYPPLKYTFIIKIKSNNKKEFFTYSKTESLPSFPVIVTLSRRQFIVSLIIIDDF